MADKENNSGRKKRLGRASGSKPKQEKKPESSFSKAFGPKVNSKSARKSAPKQAPKSGSKSGSKGMPHAPHEVKQEKHLDDEIRLNKFIAHSGLCSRREADTFIEKGLVKVNGKRVKEMGFKVKPTDKVEVEGQKMSLEPFVYILLNKAKDTITTTDDEKGRNTVMESIEDATGFRVYPVGRLDRHTTGLLILTNDGDLAHRLMHPSYSVKKTYEVTTNRPLTIEEVTKLRQGVELEDGFAKPISVKQDSNDPRVIVISVLEGRNHLIRRMIDYIGAVVEKLKRSVYGGLTVKGVRNGRWRYLKQKEINDLRKLVKLDTLDFNKKE
jgi:23S rRNA pseudouridine2605 synthase